MSGQRYRIHCVKAYAKKKTAQLKKSIKTSLFSFKESMTKESDKQNKSLTQLDYMQTVQSFFCFFFGERDLYLHTFLSVRHVTNLFASICISRELTQIKKYGYRLNYIDPLATGSNTNHVSGMSTFTLYLRSAARFSQ